MPFAGQGPSEESNSIVICRNCGHDLFDPRDILDLSSPGSLQNKNNTLIGMNAVILLVIQFNSNMSLVLKHATVVICFRFTHVFFFAQMSSPYAMLFEGCSRSHIT